MEIPNSGRECVYILRQGTDNLFKIGRTGPSVETRRRQLATGNPNELSVFDIIEALIGHGPRLETSLLNALRPNRVRDGGGRDFFRITPEELQPHIENTRALAQHISIREEATRLAQVESDGRLLEPTADDFAKREEVDKLLQQEAILRAQIEMIYDTLKVSIGTADGIKGVATWRSHEVSRLDQRAFRLDHEDLYHLYLTPSMQRPFKVC
jgi:hypothetical protein